MGKRTGDWTHRTTARERARARWHSTEREPSAAGETPAVLPLGRDSMAWRVNSEPAVFLGAGRALLMQVAHPAVGTGVERFSSYASDPWGRLFRTADIMMKLGFGTPEQVRRQERTLRAVHRRVQGVTDDGTPYRALDPELLLWVWATLVDTALRMWELVHRPLARDELARYYRESKAIAHGCGVPVGATPERWGDFVDYVEGVVARHLRVTDAARAVAVATATFPLPLPPRLRWMLGAPTRAVTTATLPPSLSDAYGFTLDAATRRRFHLVVGAVRASAAVQPEPLRRLGAELLVRRDEPLSMPALQRVGGRITTSTIRAAGYEPGGGHRPARTKATTR